MSESRDERAMKIVDDALDLDPTQRAAFVRTACGSDEALARAVEQLLACQDDAQRLFDAGDREMHSLPASVGPYHLLDVIGEGGMGVVWRAEQREPIRRTVALKLIKLGMDTNAVVARFESERQALAIMDHPNVAKVFDAGATMSGRPYFAMEYVAGESITMFCDRHGYTIRQRLELFAQACDAVQHAHQKALIHRDLKPSNILVTQPQGQPPTVKVIDFGVAKATAQRLTERTLFTEHGQLVGTPEYMSPEQADVAALDVDTRSDVYSLGVVLYELISGALPFEGKSLRAAGYAEIQRIIREVDPPRPSTRLSSLGDSAKDVARKRQTQVEELARQLRGELEWIPLKAMRKNPVERYTTAAEFGQDVRNFLAQRPLIAAPESASYRLRKFVRRNKGPVIAGMLVLAALTAGIVATSIALVGQTRARAEAERLKIEADRQRADAERERDAQAAVLTFVNVDLVAAAKVGSKESREISLAEALGLAAGRIGDRYRDRPDIESSIRATIASTLFALGRVKEALTQMQTVAELRRKAFGDDNALTIQSNVYIGATLTQAGRAAEGEPILRSAIERAVNVLGPDHAITVNGLKEHSYALEVLGRYAEQETVARRHLDAVRRLHDPDARELIRAIDTYALALRRLKRLDDALPYMAEALERSRRTQGENDRLTLGALNNHIRVLLDVGRITEADPLTGELVTKCVNVFGEDHPYTLAAQQNRAELLQKSQRGDQAEAAYADIVARRNRVQGGNHPMTIEATILLANCVRDNGDPARAEPMQRQACERAFVAKDLGPSHVSTRSFARSWSKTLEMLGRTEEAGQVRTRFGIRPSTTTSTASTTRSTR